MPTGHPCVACRPTGQHSLARHCLCRSSVLLKAPQTHAPPIMATPDQMLGAALAEVDAFSFEALDKPVKLIVPAGGEHLVIGQFPKRDIGNMRAVFHLFDLQQAMAGDADAGAVCDAFLEHGVGGLPDGIKPGSALPPNATLDLVCQPGEGGNVWFLKYYALPGGLKTSEALKLVRGEAFTIPDRPKARWNMRKAIQLLLGRIGGVQVRTAQLQSRQAPRGGEAAKWQPTPAEVEAPPLAACALRSRSCEPRVGLRVRTQPAHNLPCSGSCPFVPCNTACQVRHAMMPRARQICRRGRMSFRAVQHNVPGARMR